MLVDEFIEIHTANSNAKYYRNLGYIFNVGDYIMIKTNDLSSGSHVTVCCKCEVCGKLRNIKYKDYYKITNGLSTEYHCEKCKYSIIKQNYIDTYGVPSNLCFEETKEKIRKTCVEKYGVEYAATSELVKDKAKKTNLERYGSENPFGSDVIKQKIQNTNLSKYGVTSPAKNKDIVKKMQDTCFERFGVRNAMQSFEINNKARMTLFKNGSAPTSRQQSYLHSLYGGELNYPMGVYSLDIYLPDDNICVEYDGGGHNLQVLFGSISELKFKQKAIIRYRYIKSNGVKQISIKSRKDYLPSDSVLFDMLNFSKIYFKAYPNTAWIEFDIDNSIIRNSLYKDGIYYNYGEVHLLQKNYETKEGGGYIDE